MNEIKKKCIRGHQHHIGKLEERSCELEDRSFEITLLEENKEKKMKKS